MADFNNFNDNYNSQPHNIEPIKLIDEISTTEFYIGTSKNEGNTGKAIWQIKKIWKIGNVWNFGFPNAEQGFKFIWNNRNNGTYTYQ